MVRAQKTAQQMQQAALDQLSSLALEQYHSLWLPCCTWLQLLHLLWFFELELDNEDITKV